MRDFTKLSPKIWSSKKIQRLQGDHHDADSIILLYLYIHTSPHANSVGCYELKTGYALTDLNWESIDSLQDRIDTLQDTGLIQYDHREEVVYIEQFFEFSPIQNGKHATGAVKVLAGVPNCPPKHAAIQSLMQDRFVKRDPSLVAQLNSLLIGYPYTETQTKTQTKTETQTKTQTGENKSANADEVAERAPVSISADPADQLTWLYEQVLDAASTGKPERYKRLRTEAALQEVRNWQTLLLPDDVILKAVETAVAKKKGEPVNTLAYFRPQLIRLSEEQNKERGAFGDH